MSAKFEASESFRKQDAYEPMDRRRIVGIDTESLRSEGRLRTLLTPLAFENGESLLETPDGKAPLDGFFDALFAQPDFAQKEERPSRTVQRARRREPGARKGRDGRRETINPVLSVWFNLPYDFGRLTADRVGVLRAVAAGSDSYRIRLSDTYELEIVRMAFGNASSFEWLVRKPSEKLVLRLLGIDMTGYWKASLAASAKAAGVSEKIDIEEEIEGVYERDRSEFSEPEWEKFKDYALGDVKTHRELYLRTVELLMGIDKSVIRSTGIIPPSGPGAAARIVFAQAFVCHPEIESWDRYPGWADQMGCDAYYGGRAFCRRRGVFRRHSIIDLKSAYPFQMALLPDPVTVQIVKVFPQAFELSDWIGKYGILYITGENLDDEMPAFRVHDFENGGRLRYVHGKFENVAVTIPEIVIGVLRGALRVDAIVGTDERALGGCYLEGSPDKSFLRAGMKRFFDIKEDKSLLKALRDMAKLLMNSTYGKLIECNVSDLLMTEGLIMPHFSNVEEVARSIVSVFASAGFDIHDLYWGETDEQKAKAQAKFGEYLESRKNDAPLEKLMRDAVVEYLLCLHVAEVPRDAKGTTVRDYLRAYKTYKCGHFFMPLYAAQVTGATSAMVGLMSACVGAYQGDTDSVHVPLPDGVTHIAELPGFDRYFEIMAQAGYPSTRCTTADGRMYAGGIPEIPKLGAWEEEVKEPSIETVYVRPKVYSHKMPDGTYKQAKHGFAKFHTPEIESLGKFGTLVCTLGEPMPKLNREERMKLAGEARDSLLHEAMKTLLLTRKYRYDTRKTPRRLREAIVHGKEVGEFTSREVYMLLNEDPNVLRDSRGFAHWKPFQEEASQPGPALGIQETG